MSLLAVLNALEAAGTDVQTILSVVRAHESARLAEEDARRHKAAEKKRRQRTLSPDVPGTAGDIGGQAGTDGDAEGHSGTEDAPAPAHARVRELSPRLVNNNLTTPDCECSWPETDPPSRADLDRLEAALRQAAGVSLNAVATRLFDLSPILRLARQGKGPPCDLQSDVLPTIRARSARAPPGSVRSWDFFRDAITEARDRRLSGAPASEPRHERPHSDQRQAARTDRLGRSLAGLMAAVDEREDELGRRRAGSGG